MGRHRHGAVGESEAIGFADDSDHLHRLDDSDDERMRSLDLCRPSAWRGELCDIRPHLGHPIDQTVPHVDERRTFEMGQSPSPWPVTCERLAA